MDGRMASHCGNGKQQRWGWGSLHGRGGGFKSDPTMGDGQGAEVGRWCVEWWVLAL